MRIASAVLLGLTLVMFALWWGFVRAPGPVAVCDHILEITLREAGDHALSEQIRQRMVDSTRASCIEHKQDKLMLRGRIKYAEYAKCVVGAGTLADIGRC